MTQTTYTIEGHGPENHWTPLCVLQNREEPEATELFETFTTRVRWRGGTMTADYYIITALKVVAVMCIIYFISKKIK